MERQLEHHEDADAVVHRLARTSYRPPSPASIHRHVITDAHGVLDLLGRIPRSTKNSRPPEVPLAPGHARCGGLRAGCSAPLKAVPSAAVVTRTRWETMFAWVVPARVWSRRKPFFVHVPDEEADLVRIARQSSRARRPSLLRADDAALWDRSGPRRSKFRAPRGRSPAAAPPAPGTPGVSTNRFSNFSFSSIRLSLVRRIRPFRRG